MECESDTHGINDENKIRKRQSTRDPCRLKVVAKH